LLEPRRNMIHAGANRIHIPACYFHVSIMTTATNRPALQK
jgi:hypothetical protein